MAQTARFAALESTQFRRFWIGSFGSVGATHLLILGQGWLMFELTGSAFYLGLLGAAASVPSIIMSFLGGAIADRFDKRDILLTTSALTALALVVLALLDMRETIQVWQLLAITGFIAFVSGVDWPTRQAIFPALIDREQMLSAVALNSFIWQSTRMVLPALGGAIIALADTWVVFAIGSVGFIVMFSILRGLARVPPENRSDDGLGSRSRLAVLMHPLVEGVRYVWSTPVFRTLISLTYANMLLGTAYVQIMPVFAESMRIGEAGFGGLVAMTGVGAVSGTLLVATLTRYVRRQTVMFVGLVTSAMCIVVFAGFAELEPRPWIVTVAFACVALAAFCSSCYLVSSMTVLQLRVPDGLRGRVMGVHSIAYSLIPLGGLILGSIASVSSASVAAALSATTLMLFVAAIALTGVRLD